MMTAIVGPWTKSQSGIRAVKIARPRSARNIIRLRSPRSAKAPAIVPITKSAPVETAPTIPAALTDVADPEVGASGALIRVRAASVNGFDVYQASGALVAMMPHELPTVVGRDFSGVVVAVGHERSDVAVGDEVLGFVTSSPPLHTG